VFPFLEPGYYEDGEFGIRLEDIVQIVNAEGVKYDFNGRGAQTFYGITMVPIQTSLIDTNILTKEEVILIFDSKGNLC
jgi:Xaa-Pro aminopeptidase